MPRNIRSWASATTCLAKTPCSAAASTASRTRSGSASTPRASRNTCDFCAAAICGSRSRTSSISTTAPSSIGMRSWPSHRARSSPSASASSVSSAGRAGWRRTGARRKPIAATPGSTRRSAWTTNDACGQPAAKEAQVADINLEAVAGKLNRVGYEALFKALRQAKGAGNRNVELAHWLVHVLQDERSDIALTADNFRLDRNKLMMDINAAIGGFPKNQTQMPSVSNTVMDMLDL